jgi:hypothetical protein
MHRQRVNLLAHSIAQGGIDLLVPGHARLAGKGVGHDRGKKMPAVAFDLEVLAAQAGGDELADLLGCGLGHDAPIMADTYLPAGAATGTAKRAM